MGFELYYTSAPAGMRRGSSGFCVVGASEGLPRILGERLEALSAYKHEYAAGSGENPVSFAHWVVNVSGTAYHVLSRICDAGVDHTQRTNAFAHHVVVESKEKAAGGPAWMLRQAGVMKTEWDQRVRVIDGRMLPLGGGSMGGVCRRWGEITGDAGWGGRLADVFVASAGTPVCVLFSAGMEMLPLMEEAIALLPAEMRWGVTFNTFFTTMPTSATCGWRCCLAGTPAAANGLKYAANGVVIDLTAGQLGKAPAGAYVEFARTGRGRPEAPAGVKKAIGVAGRPAAAAEEEEEDAAPEEGGEQPVAEEPEEDFPVAPVRGGGPRRKLKVGVLEEVTGRTASAGAAKRRRETVVLLVGALAAIGVGMGLVWWSTRGSAPPPAPEEVMGPGTGQAPARTVPVVVTAPAVIERAPERVVDVTPVPVAVPVPVPVPVPVVNRRRLVLAEALIPPTAGTGIHDPEQVLAWPAGVNGVTGVTVVLPGNGKEYASHGAAGKLEVEGAKGAAGGGETTLRWLDDASPGGAGWTVGRVAAGAEGLTVEWKAGFLLTHEEAGPAVYWQLHGAAVEVAENGGKGAELTFAPLAAGAVDVEKEQSALGLPMAFPEDVKVTVAGLPEHWEAAASGDGDAGAATAGAGPSTRAWMAAERVVEINLPGEDATATASFRLLFGAGLEEVRSTFGAERAKAEAGLKASEADEAALAGQLDGGGAAGLKAETRTDLVLKRAQATLQSGRYKQALAGYNALKEFKVVVQLSGGTVVAILPFERNNGEAAATEKGSETQK